jgi:long-chain fatty acid transport protein
VKPVTPPSTYPRKRSRVRRASAAAITAVTSLAAITAIAVPEFADAAGLYFGDRGVRPLGRGGAFVAGGDDLGAIPYNPANVFDAGSQLLIDGSWVNFSSDYTRKSSLRQVDPNTGATIGTSTQTYPTVHGTTPFLPIPTLAVSFKVHPKWVVGLGVWAPYAALASYPAKVDDKPAPQRYSVLSLDGSLLVFIGATASFAPSKEWRIGATLGALTGKFNTVVNFSGCVPERFLCAPEDPEWDVLGELSVAPIVAPFAQLGATFIPRPALRLGLSVSLPVPIRSGGTLHTRLPAAPLFERATQEGDTVGVSFNLPLVLRAGLEARLTEDLRLEADVSYESWSMHKSIDVMPDHVALVDVSGFPKRYNLPTISLTRNFQDAVGLHLGGEFGPKKVNRFGLTGRAGASFETSAIPQNSMSVLTYDATKVTLALGGSMHLGRLRLDATFAHVFPFDVSVAPESAAIAQVSPVAANPPKNPNTINGGLYSARANILGLGMAYSFDGPGASLVPMMPGTR